YYSGFAGSIVSMLAYVGISVLLYKIVYSLTNHQLASVVTATIFMTNPNVLYMQSTPMTELLLFACMAGMVYGMQQWAITDQSKYLVGAAVAGLMGTMTRYEAWVLLAAMTILVVYIAWRKYYKYVRLEGLTVTFLLFSAVGIVGWVIWNQLIFGDILYFLIGDYAKPSLWVGDSEPAFGNWQIAFLTYYYAVLENLWPILAILMVIGLIAIVVKERVAPKTLPALSLTILFPFFVIALETGQRPLHVTPIADDMYNVRFGLLMVLPAAIAIGYLISIFRAHKRLESAVASIAILAATAFAFVSFFTNAGISVLQEPTAMIQKTNTVVTKEASDYLAKNYNGGNILMESFGNDMIMFNARIALRNNIYEGSYRLWEPALQYPVENKIQWIVMRHPGQLQPDRVYQDLHDKPALDSYDLVFENQGYYVYERRQS
ncbi:MAG: glycosyltransferase family 39 protein, partial [Candidatus Saccharimonadales bacterium]